MVKPHSSNFRVITTNVLGVRKLRIITVRSPYLYIVVKVANLKILRKIFSFLLRKVLSKKIGTEIKTWEGNVQIKESFEYLQCHNIYIYDRLTNREWDRYCFQKSSGSYYKCVLCCTWFNPYLPVDFSILINWTSLFPNLGVSAVLFHFYFE